MQGRRERERGARDGGLDRERGAGTEKERGRQREWVREREGGVEGDRKRGG